MGAQSRLKTRIFQFAEMRGLSLSQLANVMGLDLSTVYRVKLGQRNIGPAFIAGAKKAFPELDLDALFYVEKVVQATNHEVA